MDEREIITDRITMNSKMLQHEIDLGGVDVNYMNLLKKRIKKDQLLLKELNSKCGTDGECEACQ